MKRIPTFQRDSESKAHCSSKALNKQVLCRQLNVFLLAVACLSCGSVDSYKYLAKGVPGKKPEKFLHESSLPPDCYPQFISFSRDGGDVYIATSNENWKYKNILHAEFKNSAWTKFDTVDFTKRGDGGEPFVFGNSLFFVSFRHSKETRQTDIYKVEKNSFEDEVIHLPAVINSSANEWHPTFTDQCTMYFASERTNNRFQADIYKSNFKNQTFESPVKLSDSINSAYNDGDPLISPDEKFLIFHSERPGGLGGHDLYISFRKKDGSWTKAKNMGEAINSSELEFGPSLSPDGKYLFFTRRKAFQTTTQSEIYWVSSKIIDDLK